MKSLTPDQFIKRVSPILRNLFTISNFVNTTSNVTLTCKRCGTQRKVLALSLYAGHTKNPRCIKRDCPNRISSTRRKSLSQTLDCNDDRFTYNVNDMHYPTDKQDLKLQLNVECKECNKQFTYRFENNNKQHKFSCPNTSCNNHKVGQSYMDEIHNIAAPEFKVKQYQSSIHPIVLICQNCNAEVMRTKATNVRIQGVRCPKCKQQHKPH